jgi:hypothetical protein
VPRYGLFFGSDAVPVFTGDDASDTTALRLEDPLGSVVWLTNPNGSLTAQNLNLNTGGTLVAGQVNAPRALRARYTFAAQGGAVSTIGLTGGTPIPAGSTILGGYLSVVTPPTSGTSTAQVAIRIEAAGDTVAAAAVSGAPWSTTGHKAIIPVFTVATELLTTAARDVSAVITVEALTGGVFDVVIMYMPGF